MSAIIISSLLVSSYISSSISTSTLTPSYRGLLDNCICIARTFYSNAKLIIFVLYINWGFSECWNEEARFYYKLVVLLVDFGVAWYMKFCSIFNGRGIHEPDTFSCFPLDSLFSETNTIQCLPWKKVAEAQKVLNSKYA